MGHKRRRQKQLFNCNHRAFGKYCHRCKDEAAGRIRPKKQVVAAGGEQVVATADTPVKKYWKRAKCPYCGGSRVRKNDINALSALDAKEYRCASFECGKEFNSDQVKQYEDVEVQERGNVPYNPRLTD